MDSQTQIREDLIKSFEIRTMRSDITKLGGDWRSKRKIPLAKKPVAKTVTKAQPETIPNTVSPPTSFSPQPTPAPTQPAQTPDAKSVGDRAIERLARLKQEEEEKKLALLEVEKLQKERLELERKKREADKQETDRLEQIKLEQERKKAQEMAEIDAAKEQELRITRQKEAERRKLLEAKLQKEREVVELKQEIISLDKELQTLQEEKKPFEEERNIFLEKERQLTKNIEEIIERERTVEQEQKNVEEMEKFMETDEEKRLAEERRWAMEEKRRKIEKERWEWEEELNKIKDQTREIELKYQKIFSREKEIEAKKRITLEKQEAIQVEQERETLEKKLQEIKNRAIPFEQERALLLDKQKQIKARLDEIALQEIDIDKEKTAIEEQENSAKNATDKKAAEIKRWSIEEKRRRIEKEKWSLEDDSKKISKEIEKAQTLYQKLLNEEIELERKLGLRKEISSSINLEPKEDTSSLEARISEQEKNKLNDNTTKKQEEPENKKTDLEKFMEQVRKETEERRKTKQLQTEQNSPEPNIANTKIFHPASESIISPAPAPAPKPEIKEPITAREEKTDIQKAIARLRQEARERKNQTTNNQPKGDVKKFYEIESNNQEISLENTTPSQPRSFQAPPIPRLQDTEESLKEQESEIKKKLAEIQAEEEKERQKFLGRIQDNTKQPTLQTSQSQETSFTPETIRPISSKQSGANKIFTRVLATLLVLAVVSGVGFGIYYVLFLRVPPEPEIVMQYCQKEDRQVPATEWSNERCVPLPEIQVPAPPFTPNRIETIEITTANELKVYLSQLLERDIDPRIFQRIIIKNIDQSIWRVAHLQEFFNIMGAKMPEELYSKLNPEFHFFLWWQEQNIATQTNEEPQSQSPKPKEPRFVIITQITDQTRVLEILRFWEDTMERDTENLFRFFGKNSPAVQNYFNNIPYNTNIRCQTYALNDLGACYAVKGNFFIFSSSLDSMKTAIDRLP